MQYLFPCIGIALNFGAALVYLFAGDLVRCVYWVAAAVITICVTFGI